MPMINARSRNFGLIPAILFCCVAVFATSACSSNESKAKKLIQERMKNQGITDLQVDSFFTSKEVPGKAYTSATVTYNFATSGGNPQREFLGFILAREGSGWRIERSAGYTKDEQQAAKYLAGGK
jgi:hypothetical protein